MKLPDFATLFSLQTLAGAIITAGLGLIVYLVQRWLSGAGRQEKVTRFAALTDALTKMKAHNVTPQEVEALDGYVRSKKRQEEILQAPPPPVDGGLENEPEGYHSQAAMNAKAFAALEVSEAQLNAVMLELGHYLGDPLAQSHEAWAAYRDAQVELAAAEYDGGTIVPLIRASEADSLTRERIAWATAELERQRAL